MSLRIEELDLQELSRTESVEVEGGSGSGFLGRIVDHGPGVTQHSNLATALRAGVPLREAATRGGYQTMRQLLRVAKAARGARLLLGVTPVGLAALIGTEVAFYVLDQYL